MKILHGAYVPSAEWRIWILDGKIIGVNPYRGRWDLYPDPKVLQQAVNAYHSATVHML